MSTEHVEQNGPSSMKNEENGWTTLSSTSNFTSDGPSVPRKYQNTRENSRGTCPTTVASLRICYGCCHPPVPRLVSVRQEAPRSACKYDGNKWRSPKYLLDPLLCLTYIAKAPLTIFTPNLLRDYMYFACCQLLQVHALNKQPLRFRGWRKS